MPGNDVANKFWISVERFGPDGNPVPREEAALKAFSRLVAQTGRIYRQNRAALLRDAALRCEPENGPVIGLEAPFILHAGEKVVYSAEGICALSLNDNGMNSVNTGRYSPVMRIGSCYAPYGDERHYRDPRHHVHTESGSLFVTDKRAVYCGSNGFISFGWDNLLSANVQWALSDFSQGAAVGRLWVHEDGGGWGFCADDRIEELVVGFEIAHARYFSLGELLKADFLEEATGLETGDVRNELVCPGGREWNLEGPLDYSQYHSVVFDGIRLNSPIRWWEA